MREGSGSAVNIVHTLSVYNALNYIDYAAVFVN